MESAGKVNIKACFSINKCSKAEKKTINVPKAGKMLFLFYYHVPSQNFKTYEW